MSQQLGGFSIGARDKSKAKSILCSGQKTLQQLSGKTPSVNAATTLGDATTLESGTTQSTGTPDSNYGTMDADASLLSDLEAASCTPRFGSTVDQISPIAQPNSGSGTTTGSDASEASSASGTAPDLSSGQGATTSRADTASTFMHMASSPRNTQSPATHQLQQELRNDASAFVFGNGDASSTFANTPIVETVEENDGDDEDVFQPTNLDTMLSNASGDADLLNNSDVGKFAVNTDDPGQADFLIGVGTLGMLSGTPVDGNYDAFFGATADKVVVNNEETPPDLTKIATLLTNPSSLTDVASPSPTKVQFGKNTMHTYSKSSPPSMQSPPSPKTLPSKYSTVKQRVL